MLASTSVRWPRAASWVAWRAPPAEIADCRGDFQHTRERHSKKIEHWKQRLVELLEARLLERVLGSPQGEKTLHALAQEVAERKKDPYAAVSELLARAGLK